MYCWVIVEPPCISPPEAIDHAARAIAGAEKPGLSQNVRSSAEITASLASCGMSS